jgi:hypothetical protein
MLRSLSLAGHRGLFKGSGASRDHSLKAETGMIFRRNGFSNAP